MTSLFNDIAKTCFYPIIDIHKIKNHMTLLKTKSKEEATGAIAAVYQMMEERVKFVPNVVQLHSASPEFFEKFMPLIGHFTDHPTLDPVLVSYIRLLISKFENGTYCVSLQSAVLNNYDVSAEEISNACKDYRQINLDIKRKSLLCFVMDMMFDRLIDTNKRILELVEMGWTEKDIYEAAMLGGLQKGVVQVIKAFDVELDF